MLNECAVVGFIPTNDLAQARAFYVDRLKLEAVSENPFALVVRANGTQIRIVAAGEFTPVPYTILGWEVADIGAAVQELASDGVVFTC